MLKRKFVFLFLILAETIPSFSQDSNSAWCFGDSAGIDFTSGAPTPFHTSVKSRGSCASICDSVGNLLFYTSYNPELLWGSGEFRNGEIYNNTHQLMQNGNLISFQSWYQEVLIIPDPANIDLFYVFTIGVTSLYGLYYSVVDMSLDSGRGSVIQKNVQLLNHQASDGIKAIRHGNGRDWWIVSRRWDIPNEFYQFFVSASGVIGPFIIHAGDSLVSGFYWFEFSPDGRKLITYNPSGLIEYYDFDRCTGSLSLNQTISYESTSSPFPYYLGAAISPNGNYLYISAAGVNHPTYLVQYDLSAPDISITGDTLWDYSVTEEAGGHLKRAPDGKIYLACVYIGGTIDYPYADSSFNTVNNNLSVINYPDSPGVACGFQPFSFNLGAGRTYWGLPNNPDYELGPDSGSFCDTLTLQAGNLQFAVGKGSLRLFYHPEWEMLFVNAEGIKGKECSLQIFDLNGKQVFSNWKKTHPPYFTQDVDVSGLAGGMYLVRLVTEKEILGGKVNVGN